MNVSSHTARKGQIGLSVHFQKSIREAVKYYFADFVRKWGYPSPVYGFFWGKKGVTDLGGTPLPPFTDFPPKILP